MMKVAKTPLEDIVTTSLTVFNISEQDAVRWPVYVFILFT